jgi:hypothetical protein
MTISVENFEIDLNKKNQVSPKGRPFRLSGIERLDSVPTKWIDKLERFHSIYTFRYLDVESEFFKIELGYRYEFIKIIKNE